MEGNVYLGTWIIALQEIFTFNVTLSGAYATVLSSLNSQSPLVRTYVSYREIDFTGHSNWLLVQPVHCHVIYPEALQSLKSYRTK